MSPSLQVAFLTAQAKPGNCALSPLQRAFLDRLAVPHVALVPRDFPYEGIDRDSAVSLIRMSVYVGWQYWSSRFAVRGTRFRSPVAHLIERAPKTLFLSGSSGIELFNNLRLPTELEMRCTLFAYGPVARTKPQHSKVIMVQGRHDRISRLFFQTPDYVIDCSHMGYLKTPALLDICRTTISRELELTSCSSTFA